MSVLDPIERSRLEWKFVKTLCYGAIFLALLPLLFSLIAKPAGYAYLGSEFNQDDHMVYAAWMRQAMDGHLLFDNRFAIDAQPGITVHLYFFLLGLIAKVIGIAGAEILVRAVLSPLLVVLAYRLVKRFTPDVFTTKLALSFLVLGGGIGYFVWHNYGVELVKPSTQAWAGIMLGRLPTDVWQPEGFVFSMMLTNSLFVASLCLSLFVLNCILDCKASWQPVLPGVLAFAALMNIHSYDVLLMALVLVAFLAMALARKQASWQWILRAAIIGLGAVPPALYFFHVLKVDTVFQARAATLTYSPNFRQLVFGYLPLMLMAACGGFMSVMPSRKRLVGFAGAGVMLLYGFMVAVSHTGGYWMSLQTWALCYVAVLAICCLLATDSDAKNLMIAWALVGLIAIYFPGLFQRKLTMGLVVPWAVLAALGFRAVAAKLDRSTRNLATVFVLVFSSAGAILWVQREGLLIRNNLSNTTIHPVFISPDIQSMVEYLNKNRGGHDVLLAMPGIPIQSVDAAYHVIPDSFDPPMVYDFNPIFSGLTGVYTYAGHWSETPDYEKRRALVMRLYSPKTTAPERAEILKETKAAYVVTPVFTAGSTHLALLDDLGSFGQVVVDGQRYRLWKVNPLP
ncbi:MAG: hypothetical protein JSS72_00670 [Armatimonadetes bacterium]|nr:hypothetical protein [Armatimonadota bacterium]